MKDTMKPWVKYKCGCSEGIWVDVNGFCRDHKEPVIETSNTIALSPNECAWSRHWRKTKVAKEMTK